jgi:hypothetical protein
MPVPVVQPERRARSIIKRQLIRFYGRVISPRKF